MIRPVLTGQCPHAINHICPAFDDGCQQLKKVVRVVLKVGILNDSDITSYIGKPGSQRSSLPLIPGMIHNRNEIILKFLQRFSRAIG